MTVAIEASNYPPTGPANPPALPEDNPDPNEGIPGTGDEDPGVGGDEGQGEDDPVDPPEGGAAE